MGKRVFVPSTVNDSVSAYDSETGELQWRFFADGPVRFAPAGHGGRVYFVSDDGHLYCVDAESREARLEGQRWSGGAQGHRQSPAGLELAGAGRTGGARGKGVFLREHLVVHGDLHSRGGCGERRDRLDEQRRRNELHGAAARGAVVCLGGAAGAPGGRGRSPGGARRALDTGGVRPGDRQDEALRLRQEERRPPCDGRAGISTSWREAPTAWRPGSGCRTRTHGWRIARHSCSRTNGSIYGRSAEAKVGTKTVKDREGKEQDGHGISFARPASRSVPRDGPCKVFIKAGDRVYTAGRWQGGRLRRDRREG